MFKAVKTATAATVQDLVRATVQGGMLKGRSGAINANDEYDLIDDGLDADPLNPGFFLSFDDIYDEAAPEGSDVLQNISDMFLVPSNSHVFESNDQSRSKSFASFHPINSGLSGSDEESVPINIKLKPVKNTKKAKMGKAASEALDSSRVRSGTLLSSPGAGFLGIMGGQRPLVKPLSAYHEEEDRFEPIDHEDQDLEQYHVYQDVDQFQGQHDYDLPMQTAEDFNEEERDRSEMLMFDEEQKREEEEAALEKRERSGEVEDGEDTNAAVVSQKAKAKRAKAKKAPAKNKVSFGFKRSRAVVDDIESSTIRIKDYREWQSNTSDILRPCITGCSEEEAFEKELGALKTQLNDINQPLLCLPHVKICAQLSALYARAADPSGREVEAEEEEEEVVVKRASKRMKKVVISEKVGEVMDAFDGPDSSSKHPVRSSSILSKGDMFEIEDQQDVVRFDDIDEDQVMRFNDEEDEVMRRDDDQLSSDHELERLRAVATPGGASSLDGVRMKLQLGLDSSLKGSKGTVRSHSQSQSHSGLSPEKEAKGRGGEVGGRKHKVTGPLSPIHDQENHMWQEDEERPQFNGEGVLEDLMLEESGEASLGLGGGRGVWGGSSAEAYGRPFTLGSSGGAQQDFKLLESSGIEDPMFMSKASMMVVEIIRKRLPFSQQETAHGPRPFVSFFELLDGGRKGPLMQAQAVKLFYSLLAIQTAGFIKMEQEDSYFDLKIYPGRFMMTTSA